MSANLKPCGVLTIREKLWAAMRELKEFNAFELAGAARVDRHKYNVMDYLKGLVGAGILRKTPPAFRGDFARFELVLDSGVDAPRVRKNGTLVADDGQTRMWKVMKILKTFSVRDLVVHASLAGVPVADATAATYCRWLETGGYIALQTGDVPRWRFVRDTGAKAPQILRVKQLFDPNTGKVVTGENAMDVLEREYGNA